MAYVLATTETCGEVWVAGVDGRDARPLSRFVADAFDEAGIELFRPEARRFEAEFLDYIEREHAGILGGIRETGQLSDDDLVSLKDAITDFKKGFETTAGQLLGEEEPVEALADERVEQETIKRVKS